MLPVVHGAVRFVYHLYLIWAYFIWWLEIWSVTAGQRSLWLRGHNRNTLPLHGKNKISNHNNSRLFYLVPLLCAHFISDVIHLVSAVCLDPHSWCVLFNVSLLIISNTIITWAWPDLSQGKWAPDRCHAIWAVPQVTGRLSAERRDESCRCQLNFTERGLWRWQETWPKRSGDVEQIW